MRNALVVVALSIATLSAQSSDETRRINDAVLVLQEIMAAGDKAVPQSIMEKAAGIAVFPSLLKGGFVVGGQRGHGVLSVRNKKDGTWSAPAFLTITGGSIGAQIGGQSFGEVVFFETESAMADFKGGKFALAAQASAVALASGAGAAAKYDNGVAIFIVNPKGLMLEASVGGQQFGYQALADAENIGD